MILKVVMFHCQRGGNAVLQITGRYVYLLRHHLVIAEHPVCLF